MNKTNLLKALKICRPALGQNSIIRGIDCYYFNKNKVTAFNGALAIIADLDFEFPVAGNISGDKFFKYLNELGDEIEIKPTDDNRNIVIHCGRSKTKFAISTSDVVYFTEPEQSVTDLQLPTSELFVDGFKKCMVSIGRNAVFEDAGISLFLDPTKCEMYSTNKVTISEYSFIDESITSQTNTFLPAAFCEVFAFLKDELGTPTELTISNDFIRAKFPTVILYSSFYSTTVKQDIQEFYKKCSTIPLISIPEGLENVLKRCEIIVGQNPTIEITYTGKELNINAGVETELADSIEMEYSSSGTINVDVKVLKKLIEGCDSIGLNNNFILLGDKDKNTHHILIGRSV